MKKLFGIAVASLLVISISTSAFAANTDGVWTSGGVTGQTSFGMPAHSNTQLSILGTVDDVDLFKYLYNSNTVAFNGVTFKDFYETGVSENTIKDVVIDAADQTAFAALPNSAGKYKITYSTGRNLDGKFEAFKDVDGVWKDKTQLNASSYAAATKTNIAVNLSVSKTTYGTHMGAIDAVTYLQGNFENKAFALPSMVSKDAKWTAGTLKELSLWGESVFFGANFVPSGQANAFRGDYNSTKQLVVDGVLKKLIDVTAHKGASDTATIDTYVNSLATKDSYTAAIKTDMVKSLTYNNAAQRTYGGADLALAKVGGVWDAMLSEGIRFFAFAESDATENTASAKSYTYAKSNSSDDILEGMRSGNSFISMGNLITALDMKITNNTMNATMGETLRTVKGKATTLTVRFKNSSNAVDHIDLIGGEIGSSPNQYVDSSNIALTSFEEPLQYLTKEFQNSDVTATTKVIKTLNKSAFKSENDDYSSVTFTIPASDKDMYYRLRGTNTTKAEPTADPEGTNTEALAANDLWFYTNPVFVNAQTDGVTINGVMKDENGNPLSNTKLELNSDPIYTTTDNDGKFTFDNVEIGIHTIYVLDSNGDAVSQMTFNIQRGEKTEFDAGDIWVANDVSALSVEFSVDGENVIIKNVVGETNIIDPTDTSDSSNNPKTGTNANAAIWIVLLFASGSIITLKFGSRKRSKECK